MAGQSATQLVQGETHFESIDIHSDFHTEHQLLDNFLDQPKYTDNATQLGIQEKLSQTQKYLVHVSSRAYAKELEGTIGADSIVSNN